MISPARDPVLANVGDQIIEFGVQQRLAPAKGDDRCAQSRQLVNAGLHHIHGNRLGEIVVLVAIGTGEIAAANRNDMRQDGVVRRGHSFGDHLEFADAALRS